MGGFQFFVAGLEGLDRILQFAPHDAEFVLQLAVDIRERQRLRPRGEPCGHRQGSRLRPWDGRRVEGNAQVVRNCV